MHLLQLEIIVFNVHNSPSKLININSIYQLCAVSVAMKDIEIGTNFEINIFEQSTQSKFDPLVAHVLL